MEGKLKSTFYGSADRKSIVAGIGGPFKQIRIDHAYFSGPLAGGNSIESKKMAILLRCR